MNPGQFCITGFILINWINWKENINLKIRDLDSRNPITFQCKDEHI